MLAQCCRSLLSGPQFATSLCTNILPMASFWILNIVGTKEFTESPCKRCIKQTTNQPQVNKVYQKLHARRLVRIFEKWDLTVRTLDSSQYTSKLVVGDWQWGFDILQVHEGVTYDNQWQYKRLHELQRYTSGKRFCGFTYQLLPPWGYRLNRKV